VIAVRPQYRLSADCFEITPQPSWIHSDVKADVIRDGNLDQLSILDPDLTRRVVQAFELNTWVLKVMWAGKRPGQNGPRVIVQVRYREPIIMVRTRDAQWNGDCFWPVDTQGVFLPPEEFSATQTRNYLRVEAGSAMRPQGAAGTPYGDAGVAGAASLATLIGADWQAMGLQWIVVRKDLQADVMQPLTTTYVLLPRGGDPDRVASRRSERLSSLRDDGPPSLEIFWGHAPGQEPAGEATAAQKLVRLQNLVRQKGRLDEMPATTVIDLRSPEAISVIDRPARFQPASTR
jgi:hypothetical protein